MAAQVFVVHGPVKKDDVTLVTLVGRCHIIAFDVQGSHSTPNANHCVWCDVHLESPTMCFNLRSLAVLAPHRPSGHAAKHLATRSVL